MAKSIILILIGYHLKLILRHLLASRRPFHMEMFDFYIIMKKLNHSGVAYITC